MEAHGNEYLAQLLDRAANLITGYRDDVNDDHPGSEAAVWLREYHAEKARFGQPEGSPAYAENRGVQDEGDDDGNRTAKDAAAANRERRQPAPRAKKG